MEKEDLFIATFTLYQCSYTGTFSLTENIHRLVRAEDEEAAIKKLKEAYKNTVDFTFQILNASASRIIT